MVLALVLRFGRMSVDEDLGLGFGVLAPRFGKFRGISGLGGFAFGV